MCIMIIVREMFLTTHVNKQLTEWDHVETIPEALAHDTPTPLHLVYIGYHGYSVQGLLNSLQSKLCEAHKQITQVLSV